MNFNGIKNVIVKTTGRSGLLLKKHSPEILMVVGVAGVVTSAVMACRATLKAEGVINNAKYKIDKIHEAKNLINADPKDLDGKKMEYSEQDYKKDLAVAYLQTGVDFVKLYGPAVLVGVASISCLLGSHHIMRKRNLGLIAAYKAVEKSFADYRKRVVEELGVDKDREFKHGVGKVERTTYDYSEGGDGKKETETFEVVDPNNISMYARYFAKDHSTEWNERQDYNLMFLKCQQKIANDLLHSRGHIFLNEVYDLLGFKRCPEGAVVGWAEGQGDDFVDFGIYNVDVDKYRDENSCDTVGEERLDFVNGTRNSILLDFNVSGVMYDLI